MENGEDKKSIQIDNDMKKYLYAYMKNWSLLCVRTRKYPSSF